MGFYTGLAQPALAPLTPSLLLLLQLPVLLRGTADDDVPCPGYLFEEIASILPGRRAGCGRPAGLGLEGERCWQLWGVGGCCCPPMRAAVLAGGSRIPNPRPRDLS